MGGVGFNRVTLASFGKPNSCSRPAEATRMPRCYCFGKAPQAHWVKWWAQHGARDCRRESPRESTRVNVATPQKQKSNAKSKHLKSKKKKLGCLTGCPARYFHSKAQKPENAKKILLRILSATLLQRHFGSRLGSPKCPNVDAGDSARSNPLLPANPAKPR